MASSVSLPLRHASRTTSNQWIRRAKQFSRSNQSPSIISASFGLLAEQVEKVNPDLVARDEQGKPYTVRYEAVNAMLLNEFLKEHHQVQDLKSAAAKQ